MKRGVRSLKGAVVLVTGGARGIGAAIATDLAAQGARVAIGDVDSELAGKTAAELGALAIDLDVTDPASWKGAVAAVAAELGPVDILVNNAGIMPVGPFMAETDTTSRRQVDINILGVTYGCRAVIPGMTDRRSGHIVNIASQAGKMALAGAVTYHATKYAVVGLSHALDDELRSTGIAVTCVLPGIVNTELSAGLEGSFLAPRVEPEDIARAVRSALRRPRAEVWMPRSGLPLTAVVRNVPVNARARMTKLIGLEDPMLNIDPAARAAYEERAKKA